MKPAPFQYHAPQSTDEAVALLHEHQDDVKVLAGGQSLVPVLALRLTHFEHLVDLNQVASLAFIDEGPDELVIGAMTRQATAEHSRVVASRMPLLAEAIPHIGHFQIRNRGTVGGSIAHADPASELPTVALAADALMELRSHRGTRRVPAADFFFSIWETTIEDDELLAAIHFPTWGPRSGFAIEEMAWRRGDFAITGVACGIELGDEGSITRCTLAFMGMGTTPLRATAAEQTLLGEQLSEVDLEEIASLAISDTSPTDDVHATADYRRTVARVLVRRALQRANREATGE